VLVLLADHLVARLTVKPERNLVRHRGRRDVDGLLVTEELSDSVLEQVDGRVFPPLLVPDLGLGDRLPHPGGRLGLRIRPEIDHAVILAERAAPRRDRGLRR
jgi:hypothetical protein